MLLYLVPVSCKHYQYCLIFLSFGHGLWEMAGAGSCVGLVILKRISHSEVERKPIFCQGRFRTYRQWSPYTVQSFKAGSVVLAGPHQSPGAAGDLAERGRLQQGHRVKQVMS